MLLPLAAASKSFKIPGDEIYLFEFPAAAINRIVLGAKATNTTEQKVAEIIAANQDLQNIRLERATLDENRRTVVIR